LDHNTNIIDDLRYFAELAFKGTNYHGWQIQSNALSVQEVFNAALSTVLRLQIETLGSGRTDTGVHARQLFAHFDCESSFVLADLVTSLNSLLPPDISVICVFEVSPKAHARFDAVSREYEYRIHFSKDPFYYGLSTRLTYKPNFERMNEAAALLAGSGDFSSFSKSRTQVKTNFCTIEFARWEEHEDQWIFRIKANRFLRNMVRAIVGTLLEVGKGELSVSGFLEVIQSANRSRAGMSVPAEGLYLCCVEYPYTLY